MSYLYPNYQQSYNNPFLQQQQLPQQMVQQVVQPQQIQPIQTVVGKFVQSAEEIGVSDVPMNGQYSVFPRSDMGEIYAKAWDGNGNIQTVIYRPVMPQNEQKNDDGTNVNAVNFIDELQAFKQEIMARFDALEQTGKAQSQPKRSQKKEGDGE